MTNSYATCFWLPPGNGKSFVILIACWYLKNKDENRRIYVVLPTDYLRTQMEKFSNAAFAWTKPPEFITHAELPSNLYENALYFVDEVVHCWTTMPITTHALTKKVTGFWALGRNPYKAVFCSGIYSQNSAAFVRDCYVSSRVLDFPRHSQRVTGLPKNPDFTVICKPNFRDQCSALLEKANELQNDDIPVIIFGLKVDKTIEYGFPETTQVDYVDSDLSAASVSSNTYADNRRIILCQPRYYVGCDFRFPKDATVLILAKESRPHYEVLMQMFGRGARSMASFYGYLFMLGAKGTGTSQKDSYLQYVGPDFKGLAKNVRLAHYVAKLPDTAGDQARLAIKTKLKHPVAFHKDFIRTVSQDVMDKFREGHY